MKHVAFYMLGLIEDDWEGNSTQIQSKSAEWKHKHKK